MKSYTAPASLSLPNWVPSVDVGNQNNREQAIEASNQLSTQRRTPC